MDFALGDSAWRAGDVALAQQQLDIVVGTTPTHVPALRVLALMAATRGNTATYIAGLQLVAAQVPEDLDMKSNIAVGIPRVGGG